MITVRHDLKQVTETFEQEGWKVESGQRAVEEE